MSAEIPGPDPSEKLRISGDLLRKTTMPETRVALTEPKISLNMGRKAPSDARTGPIDQIKTIGDVKLSGEQSPIKIGSGLEGFLSAKVTGLKHLARTEVGQFDSRDYNRRGTFGRGLYLGANNPVATTDLNEIRRGDHFVHDIEVTGNVLSIDMTDEDAFNVLGTKLPDDVYEEFLESGFGGASILMEHPIDGVSYDALIFHRTVELPEGPYVQTEAILRNPSESAQVVSSQAVAGSI
jgi:hypothetical protein